MTNLTSHNLGCDMTLAPELTTCTASTETFHLPVPSAACVSQHSVMVSTSKISAITASVFSHATYLDREMAGRHRCRPRSIQVIRTDVVPDAKVQRPHVLQFMVSHPISL